MFRVPPGPVNPVVWHSGDYFFKSQYCSHFQTFHNPNIKTAGMIIRHILLYLFRVVIHKHIFLGVFFLIVFLSLGGGASHHIMVAPEEPAPAVSPFFSLDSAPVAEGLLYRRIDSFFERRHRFGGFNGNVLIMKGNTILYKGCFGYCNYSTRDTLVEETPFQIASSSKPFTATAVLRLVDEGKLSLSDTLGSFFPGFPYRHVTVQMLLCHRSGLPDYLVFGDRLWKDRRKYMTNDSLLALLMKYKNLEGTSRPGTHFRYNNTNFALLASIVEKVTGRRFPEYMKETFFDPLGMKNTWIRDVENNADERSHAISYGASWQVQAEDPYDGVYGDKNVFSTTQDMIIWDRAFYQEKNLCREMQAEAYKPRSFEQKGARNYGYGWRLIQQANGESVIYHNGWWHGNNTVFYRYLPDSLAIVVLSNRYNVGVYNIQPVVNLIRSTHEPVEPLANEGMEQ